MSARATWLARNGPWLLLAFVSIGIAELLTGSTPLLAALTNPFVIPSLLGYYGAGVLAIREVTLRWRQGWASLILLGGAYGVLEEGIGTKTFFDPNAPPVHALGIFGHWAGVNWVWAVLLTLFHSLFSIALPILLFYLAFPEHRNVRFFSDRGLVVVTLILLAVVGLTSVALDPTHYWEGWSVVLGAALVMLLLVLLAWRAPRWLLRPRAATPRFRPLGLGLLGAAFSAGFFLITYAGPSVLPVPIAIVVLELGFCGVSLGFFLRWGGRKDNEPHLVAFSVGMLSFLSVFAVPIAFAPGEFLMPSVAGGAIFFLWRLWRRVRRRALSVVPPGAGPPEPSVVSASGSG